MPDDSPHTFVRAFPAPGRAAQADNPATKSEREFKASAQAVHILFQISDTEIPEMPAQRQARFQTDDDEQPRFAWSQEGRERSFIFAAVQLKPRPNNLPYSRTHYARFAREINKRIVAPVVALFQTQDADEISFAFIGRRPSKTQPDRDVLERVSVIRGVSLDNPHTAHIRILAELSLSERRRWMDARAKPQNFDGLLDAWLDALDTDALNKKFYQELFKWFERALDAAQFPPNGGAAPKDHIIRMLTRLIFIWFIKEKKLVHPSLFIEAQVNELLKDYDRDNGDSYYRAVLQNLFFATLNTEIDKRRFSRDNRADHRNPGLYRYKDLMAQPDDMLAMFKDTPFVNGGLFDCLDDFAGAAAGGRRVDCFTDNLSQRKELSVPNRLFFGEHGLIALFHRYKFTVEENTPLEQEVALDPELLGNVFENLLAATTRETQETARKQTGSYYTPRAVVDYMVDESLIAALSEKIAPANADREALRNNLRQLLSYGEDDERAAKPFTSDDERKAIVKAVAELKIIDPAVGSGAFPMGILHKLTLALRRIDPDNDLWAAAQVEIAVDRTRQVYAAENDAQRREHIQRRINADFERHKDSDFGRKLYLIQNAIYGVDIQPIAAQIAKLRFFISLAIEQSRSGDIADNYGIRALPNLETRFVAANALIALTPGGDFNRLMDDNNGATRQIAALNDLRARHIAAADRQDKLDIINQEKQAQARLAAELDQMRADWETGQLDAIELKIAALNKQQQAIVRKEETAKYENRKAKFESEFADAQKIAAWKPLDQNAPAADWFDAKYMFDVKDGFDVVIGNPPYVRSEAGDANRKLRNQIIASGQYQTLYEKWDLFIPFIERSHQLAKQGGFTTLIVSDAYCHARYARKSQDYFLANSRIVRLDFFGKLRLFQAGVHNIVYLFQKADGKDNKPERRVHYPEFGAVNLLPTDEQRNLTHRVFFPEDIEAQAFSAPTLPLSEICYISYGLRPSSKPGAPSKFVTADVTSDTQDAVHSKPYVDGKHLDYWLPATNLWLEWGTKRSPAQFYAPTFPEFYEVEDKLLLQKNTGANPKACYDDRRIVFSASVIGAVPWHRLSGIRNASIRKQARYENEKQTPNLPQREPLESIGNQYDTKFLLGVINSSAARQFLLAHRRHNISIYPDDWKKLPIPAVSPEEQAPLATLVNAIISAKATGKDTADLEAQADALVNALYGLTPPESAAASRAAP